MMTLVHAYAIALIVALLIGILVARSAFRRSGAVAPTEVISASSPAVAPQPMPPPAAPPEIAVAEGPPDNLQTLKGVGAKFAASLNEAGITRFDQLARLSPADIAFVDEQMGPFKGRLTRDRVVEQAGYLARDDREGFERTFGNLGSGA